MFPEIVCPVDKLRLTERGETLVCLREHKWEINQGIPRMALQKNNYTDAFGLQWKTYRKTQLDSYNKSTISYDRLRRCLGEEVWGQLYASQEVFVLEAGCGSGRFTEILLNTPSAHVTSIDYSSAVEANQENFPQNNRHQVIQADILLLPFTLEQFDIVLCLGVVQHTINPEETIWHLYEHVKPGGWLVLDHYTYSLSRLTKSASLIRPILKRVPPRRGLQWTEYLVKTFFPIHRAVRNKRILQMLLSRISPVLSYYHIYPQLNHQFQYEWALLDTHDSLTDYYKHSRTKGRVKKSLVSVGAVDIHCEYGGNGVEARCRKPSC
jgi:2-polyprenyl-3-methyl-5-hydroxy-6-metoxy-1,4-benzoquinol methylase